MIYYCEYEQTWGYGFTRTSVGGSFARTRGVRVGPSMGVDAGGIVSRVPCGLRTVIVIPEDVLRIADAGRTHAIHGQAGAEAIALAS